MTRRRQLLRRARRQPQKLVADFLALERHVQELTAEVRALKDRVAQTSVNSHKPPSSDGLAKPKPRSLRQKSGRKPGGQPGHPRRTLAQVKKPDHQKDHPLRKCYESLAPVENAIVNGLRRAGLLHLDESGLRVASRLHWLHVACTAQLTFYGVHERRGTEAMDALGVLPHCHRWLLHDHWKPYHSYDALHALCNQHLLRDSNSSSRNIGSLGPPS